MNDLRTVLCGDFIGANSPDTLFLAAKLVDQFGAGPTPAMTIPELCRSLALSTFRGRKAVRNLTHLGLLSVERQFWTSYPSYCFKLRFDRLTEPVIESAWPHKKRAKQLLLWGEHSPEEHPHQLRIPLRLLLLILFAHATPVGVVEGLSHNELAKRTGQNLRQIRDQLKRLARYGYIRQIVEGGNFEGPLSRKTNVYLLNLHHEAYSGDAASGFIAMFTLQHFTPEPIDEAIQSANRYLESGGSESERPTNGGGPSIADLSSSELRRPEALYLRWLVRQLASDLLTSHSPTLIADEPYSDEIPKDSRIDKETILEVYRHCDEMIPNPGKESLPEEEPHMFAELMQSLCIQHSTQDATLCPQDGDTARENLKLFLTSSAIQLALQAAKGLSTFTDTTAEDYRYLILPQSPKRKWVRLLTVCAIAKQPNDGRSDVYYGSLSLLQPIPANTSSLKRIKENEISPQVRAGAGMQTLRIESPSLKRAKKEVQGSD